MAQALKWSEDPGVRPDPVTAEDYQRSGVATLPPGAGTPGVDQGGVAAPPTPGTPPSPPSEPAAPTTTPLYDFSAGLGLEGPGGYLPQRRTELAGLKERRQQLTDELAAAWDRSGVKAGADLENFRKLVAQQEAERTAEKPPELALPKAPTLAGRPFLDPPKDLLGQIQTAMLGIGQLAMGFAGLQGRGYAIAATSALKGAVEGWVAGDRERVQNELETWRTQSEKLLAEHKARRERYADMLTDHTLARDTRLAQIELQAKIDGNERAAQAAKIGNVDALIKLHEQETDREIQLRQTNAQIAHWLRGEYDKDRAYAETVRAHNMQQAEHEASRKLRERALEARLPLLQLPKMALDAAGKDKAITDKLRELDNLEGALDYAESKGFLVKGGNLADRGKQELVLATTQDEQLNTAVQTIRRIGTSLFIGREIGLGATARTLGLKKISETEVANLLQAPRMFWDQELPALRKNLEQQRELARNTLKAFPAAMGLLAPMGVGAEGEDADHLNEARSLFQ